MDVVASGFEETLDKSNFATAVRRRGLIRPACRVGAVEADACVRVLAWNRNCWQADYARETAFRKAKAVFEQADHSRDTLVIGADTIVVAGKILLEKPKVRAGLKLYILGLLSDPSPQRPVSRRARLSGR